MPKSSDATDAFVVKVFVENVPRVWLRQWLTCIGWRTTSNSKEVLQMQTAKPKAIGEMASLHALRGRTMVHAAAKLYKPAGEPRARAMLALVPPARIIHRVRDDRTESLEMCLNLAILNEVSARPHIARFICYALPLPF
eukprot:2336446-Pleurochrysis_carterae.AAC.1